MYASNESPSFTPEVADYCRPPLEPTLDAELLANPPADITLADEIAPQPPILSEQTSNRSELPGSQASGLGDLCLRAATIRPFSLEERKSRAPTASEQAYFRSDRENEEIYGATAFSNYKTQLRSQRAVQRTDQRLKQLHDNVKHAENETDAAEAEAARAGDPNYQRYTSLKQGLKSYNAQMKDAAPDSDRFHAARAGHRDVLRRQYEEGFITLADYRTRYLGKDPARATVAAALEEPFKAEKGRGQHLDAAKKQLHATIMQERLQDMLLAAPNVEDMEDFLAETTAKTARVVSHLSASQWVTTPSKDTMQQIQHEYLNAALYPNYKVEFSVGLGGSPDSPSLPRLPAYLTPALEHMRSFQDAGISNLPQLRIFNAHEMSAAVNSLDPTSAKQHANETEALLRHYVSEFYPDLAESVSFEQPRAEELLTKETDADLAWLEARANQPAEDEADVASQSLRKAVKKLQLRGAAHGDGGDEGTLRYAAAHPRPQAFRRFNYVGDDGPDASFKWGGSGENDFNTIQSAVAQHHRAEDLHSPYYATNSAGNRSRSQHHAAHAARTPVDLEMLVAGKPPYYSAGEGTEITLKNAAQFREMLQNGSMDDVARHYGDNKNEQIARQTTRDIQLMKELHGARFLHFMAEYAA
jgi:hypothetical protein